MIVSKMEVREEETVRITNARDVLNLSIKDYLLEQAVENFVVIALNASHKVSSIRVIGIGSVNNCSVHNREIFRYAVLENASAIIVCHNHPSGNSSPSEPDLKTTKTIVEAGKIIGIKVLDHIIVSKNDYFSFIEHDLI